MRNTFSQPNGVTGITYGAQWRTNLVTGAWTPITDTGSGSTHTFSVPTSSNQQIFFRYICDHAVMQVQSFRSLHFENVFDMFTILAMFTTS